ncbi:DUF4279 domain-containing protein [Actinoplanes xinjiangensis]|uniref:DUF4279 domain-containing protein n=1 Tax=Actinoplanes xinjiangensis TaxID=512350 RepID=UPI0034225968
MKIRQETALAIFSASLSPEAISELVGMPPTKSARMGERRTEPLPVPRKHQWSLVERSNARVGEQVGSLMERVYPAREHFISVARQPGIEVGLMIVRYLQDPEGIEDSLGIHIPADAVIFLAEMNAAIDIDEYDYGPAKPIAKQAARGSAVPRGKGRSPVTAAKSIRS